MKRKKAKKKPSYLPYHRYVVQWNYKLSDYGTLKWRNHSYFRTKKEAKRYIKKESAYGIYRHRIKRRW